MLSDSNTQLRHFDSLCNPDFVMSTYTEVSKKSTRSEVNFSTPPVDKKKEIGALVSEIRSVAKSRNIKSFLRVIFTIRLSQSLKMTRCSN